MKQMMIQSMVNIQFEQVKKQFKEQEFKLGDIINKNPRELQCFGFYVSDLDLSFKKSQAQFSLFYKPVENPNKEICDKFATELGKSPEQIMAKMKQLGPGKGLEDTLMQIKDASAQGGNDAPKTQDGKQKASKDKKVVHDEL